MIKFGTDGWRAVIAEDFTFDNVKIVSQAIADYLKKQTAKKKKIVVGYDRRFLSKEFAETASCVFAANGIKVVLSDRDVPTPTVSFHCLYGKYDLGIMITASHNPAKFNGLKIKTSEGGSADKPVTDAVEKLLGKNNPKYTDISLARKKKSIKEKDLTVEHVKFLRKLIDLKKVQKAKLKILVDIMYGSGDSFVERILKPCQATIDYIHNEFNPSFGGIHPEPVESNVKELMAKVKKDRYDLGLILDGDADRIAMVDGKGNYINAQVILPILAMHMIKNRKAFGGIGKTVVGSNVIDKVALDLGAPCYETPVGFKYISNLFKQKLICIGGEEAGGIGIKGYIPERDGSVSFVLMLEMLSQEGKNFNQILADFYRRYGRYYYSRTAIPVKSVKKSLDDMKLPKEICGKKIQRINKLDGIKLIAQDSWLMFRKSGTEPIVRVYAESRSSKESKKLVALGTRMIYAL